MADHLTEEEQIETIKRWWRENWLSVVAPIALAILAYSGWNYWGDFKSEKAQAASERYQAMMVLLEEAGPELGGETQAQVLAIADEIASEFSGTLYDDLSSMAVAGILVKDGALEEAASRLQAVVDAPASEPVKAIAKARLARVFLAQEKFDAALALVAQADDDTVAPLYHEIRGDIFAAQGDNAAATTAYEEALAAIPAQQFNHRGLVQFKLDSVKPALAVVTEETAEAAQE